MGLNLNIFSCKSCSYSYQNADVGRIECPPNCGVRMSHLTDIHFLGFFSTNLILSHSSQRYLDEKSNSKIEIFTDENV
jgi:hypothetical protein